MGSVAKIFYSGSVLISEETSQLKFEQFRTRRCGDIQKKKISLQEGNFYLVARQKEWKRLGKKTVFYKCVLNIMGIPYIKIKKFFDHA